MIVDRQETTLIAEQNAAPISASLSETVAILFDIDDTLIDTAAAKEKKQQACTAVLKDLGVAAEDAVRYYSSFYSIVNGRSDHPLQTLGLADAQLQALLTAYNEIWPELLPETAETLGELKRRGYVLGCITNGPSKLQREKIERLGLGTFREGSSRLAEGSALDFAVISGDIGCEKPQQGIYLVALHQVQSLLQQTVDTGRVMFVGDRPSDWIGANAVGMISVQIFRDSNGTAAGQQEEFELRHDPPAYRITSVADLLEILPQSSYHTPSHTEKVHVIGFG